MNKTTLPTCKQTAEEWRGTVILQVLDQVHPLLLWNIIFHIVKLLNFAKRFVHACVFLYK